MLYTAQDVAHFCEVDLKTVHHWADRGKIPHYRTEGRHLRFRRNDVVRFLRAHGYPIPDALARVKPAVAFALGDAELAKNFTSRFVLHRYENATAALIRLVADAPDALVVGWSDPSFGGSTAARTIKTEESTRFIALVAIADDPDATAAREAGAEVILPHADLPKLGTELARLLAIT